MRLLIFVFLISASAHAAQRYVDSAAAGAANGTSWADAWTTLSAVTGLSSGDFVNISGGSSGTKTYSTTTNGSYPGQWLNVVNGVTYRIGQDAGHKEGVAILNGQATASSVLTASWTNVTISGDAGDGLMHLRVTNAAEGANGANWSGVRVTYVDFQVTTSGVTLNPATNVEIDHCSFVFSGNDVDRCSYGLFSGGTWDTSKFHHNTVSLPYRVSDGNGADGLQWSGSGFSIYNNTFTAVINASYATSQHQDGWQSLGNDSFIKIYNNLYVGMTGYSIYAEFANGGFTDMLIYNNVAIASSTVTPTQAFVVSASTAKPCTRVVVANNLAEGYANPFTFRNPSGADAPAFVNCVFTNNIIVSTGTNLIDAAISSANNVSISSGNAPTNFVTWSSLSDANNYRLLVTATTLIALGSDLSAYFTTDAAGYTRGVPWDIGAYEWFAATLGGLNPSARGPTGRR